MFFEPITKEDPGSISQAMPHQSSTFDGLADDSADLSAAIHGFTSIIAQQSGNQDTASECNLSVCTPDEFNSMEPKKLQGWLFQLDLLFSSKPCTYHSNHQKVNTAISYLSGYARDHFRELAHNDANPLWREDYRLFVVELRIQFGITDEENEARRKLDRLCMSEHHHINKYLIKFNHYRTLVGYNEQALCHKFYAGLPNCIQDVMSLIGRPKDLPALIEMALRIDSHYWARQAEHSSSRTQTLSFSSSGGGNTSSPSRSREYQGSGNTSRLSGNTSGRNTTNNLPRSNPRPPQNTSSMAPRRNAPATTNPAYVSNLTSEGRLNDAERQRRRNEGLCLYCGCPGHTYNDCRRHLNRANNSSNFSRSSPQGNRPQANSQAHGRALQPINEDSLPEHSAEELSSEEPVIEEQGN